MHLMYWAYPWHCFSTVRGYFYVCVLGTHVDIMAFCLSPSDISFVSLLIRLVSFYFSLVSGGKNKLQFALVVFPSSFFSLSLKFISNIEMHSQMATKHLAQKAHKKDNGGTGRTETKKVKIRSFPFVEKHETASPPVRVACNFVDTSDINQRVMQKSNMIIWTKQNKRKGKRMNHWLSLVLDNEQAKIANKS